MEVMVPMAPAKNFHADKSEGSTPYVSAPSSPRGFDYLYHYTSAPASPTRITAIYSSIPFQWGDKPHPSNDADADHQMGNNDDDNFEFNFSGQLQKGALPPELTAADELFEAGKIRTVKQPRSQPSKSRRGAAGEDVLVRRGRGPSATSSRARSLSPLRGGGGGGIGVGKEESSKKDNTSSSSSSSSSSSIVSFLRSAGNGSKKWRLRDLLLFRSASEGRVTGRGSKDPLRKYAAIVPPLSSKPSSGGEDSKSSSFRSTDSGGSVRRGALSPHEMHYTANRAASEELRKKTPLPYRQGLFGCLRFNPAVTAISRGFNTQSFSRG